MRLGEEEQEKETNKFGHSSIEGTTINRMMKFEGRGEVNHKCIKSVFILCLKMLMSFW